MAAKEANGTARVRVTAVYRQRVVTVRDEPARITAKRVYVGRGDFPKVFDRWTGRYVGAYDFLPAYRYRCLGYQVVGHDFVGIAEESK
jgi:hypothetical protein